MERSRRPPASVATAVFCFSAPKSDLRHLITNRRALGRATQRPRHEANRAASYTGTMRGPDRPRVSRATAVAPLRSGTRHSKTRKYWPRPPRHPPQYCRGTSLTTVTASSLRARKRLLPTIRTGSKTSTSGRATAPAAANRLKVAFRSSPAVRVPIHRTSLMRAPPATMRSFSHHSNSWDKTKTRTSTSTTPA
jgi:hypothetical protein